MMFICYATISRCETLSLHALLWLEKRMVEDGTTFFNIRGCHPLSNLKSAKNEVFFHLDVRCYKKHEHESLPLSLYHSLRR